MKPSLRILFFAAIVGVLTLGAYYVAAVVRGSVEGIAWNTPTAIVLTVLGLAAGAAWGSRAEFDRWKTLDVILAGNLALVFGLLFLGWGLVWDAVKPLETVLPGLRDIVYGFWFLAAIVVPYVVRKPGAAIAAETLAALAEFLAGGQWGLTLLISGLVQGGMAEIVFAATGYKKWNLPVLAIAGAAAGIGSLVVDYAFWYTGLAPTVLVVMLVMRLISGALVAGWFGKWIVDGLAKAGALGSFAIVREKA
ncbi:MAG: ECF transporter S component [Chloroflexi bacterium]|nr:ECF transporter S component [Chloroflexota bacterium]